MSGTLLSGPHIHVRLHSMLVSDRDMALLFNNLLLSNMVAQIRIPRVTLHESVLLTIFYLVLNVSQGNFSLRIYLKVNIRM
jgi:hypothetical protein